MTKEEKLKYLNEYVETQGTQAGLSIVPLLRAMIEDGGGGSGVAEMAEIITIPIEEGMLNNDGARHVVNLEPATYVKLKEVFENNKVAILSISGTNINEKILPAFQGEWHLREMSSYNNVLTIKDVIFSWNDREGLSYKMGTIKVAEKTS